MAAFINQTHAGLVNMVGMILIGAFVIYSTNYVTLDVDPSKKSIFSFFSIGSKKTSEVISHVSYWSMLALILVLIANFFMGDRQKADIFPSTFLALAGTLLAGGYYMHSILGANTKTKVNDEITYFSIIFFVLGLNVSEPVLKFTKSLL